MPNPFSPRRRDRSAPGTAASDAGSAHAPARSAKQRGFSVLALLGWLLFLPLMLAAAAASVAGIAVILANDRLPSLDVLVDYRPKIPLRVYTADNVLIGEFGEERRSFVRIADVPPLMRNAILAAEDDRFFEHMGIDLAGVIRAAVNNLTSSGGRQGASTITQQVARNFFLSSERTYIRKIFEILLALKIEESLSKEQILEIYINQIFLGQRAYGFAAAAQTYFGKSLAQLTAAEAAMLVGLPKAPSEFNPVVNPRRATIRQHYVLDRMRKLGHIDEDQHRLALAEPLKLRTEPTGAYAVRAPYVAELARLLAYDLFKDEVYGAGLSVYTTVLSEDQRAANDAVRQGILDYDRRYGYRGPEAFVDLPSDATAREQAIQDALEDRPDVEEFATAVVIEASPRLVRVSRGRAGVVTLEGDGLKFAGPWLAEKAPAAKRLRAGAVVRVAPHPKGGWEITQVPEVQSAFVATNTADGSVRAMVGGFDFNRNKFNRVVQAWRQPGSSFKPFIYSASLEKGFMTSTVVNDAPIHIDSGQTGSQAWEPKNYDGKFDGPMTLRAALAKSKNMVSIRVLQSIGTQYAQDYVTRFGFEADKHPAYLTMALGAGSVTPLQMVGGISVFANGGYRVDPYVVTRIVDQQGRVLAQAKPVRAGDEAQRVIDARNAFLMDSLMRDVVKKGTATRALSLKRADLAGKTGTTNDSHDAWFVGYQPSIAAVAWVGFDQPRKLGDRETGGGLALPIWINYMAKALKGVPEAAPEPPQGIVQLGSEYYYAENRPGQGVGSVGVGEGVAGGAATPEKAEQIRDQLF